MKKANRLSKESSPYLLQHQYNPVDWYPWGDEAFAKAKKENKPIFLSIGYSTCHWCHVMEHESFEDEEVAKLMNDAFICIKVDREERPDIDKVYMAVTQAMTQRGGWPMTIVMTPDKKPFFAGTYFPKESRYGRVGMMDLVPQISNAWKNSNEKLLKSANDIVNHLISNEANTAGDRLADSQPGIARNQFMASFDSKYGGFGNKPKFPSPHNFSLLLRSYQRDKKDATLKMVEKSLKEMRKGGIYDQVGFGFHRYSTDEHWLLPHFEKMLYDQAMLIIAYTEAYQVTEDPFYKEVVEEIIEYIKRDMTSPEGGFYSAEDADSDGVEGKFYVWTREEIIEILGKEDGEFYAKVYNIEAKGNFTDEATGHKTKDNIPHLKAQFFELASAYKMKRPDFKDKVYTLRKKLFLVRERRIHPLKDDKILTDWNGLMITALAKAGAALQNEDYIEMAEKAADFVLKTLRNKKGRLLKRYRKGKAGLTAHLEDYAFVTWGLIELYQASFKSKYLKDAVSLTDIMIKHFYDNKKGGFFMTADDSEKLFIRSKEIYDGAIPSGNSVACLTLQQLSQLTGNPVYLKFSEGILKAFSKEVERYPRGFSQLMIGLDYATGPSYEIVISGDPEKDDTKAMIKAIQKKFIPGKVIILRPAEDNKEIIALAPYLKDQKMKDKKATAYVCQNFACKQPVTSVKELLKNLGRE